MKCPHGRPSESVCLAKRRDDRAIGRVSECGKCGRVLSAGVVKKKKTARLGNGTPPGLSRERKSPSRPVKQGKGSCEVRRNDAGSSPARATKVPFAKPGAQGEGKKRGRATGKAAPHSVRYMSFAGANGEGVLCGGTGEQPSNRTAVVNTARECCAQRRHPSPPAPTHAEFGRMGAAVRWKDKVKTRPGFVRVV